LAETKTRYGVMTAPDVQTDIIGRFLQHYGEWAWDEAVFVGSVVNAGARILDVGAYLGTFGLGLSAQTALGYVCFVEANPTLISALRKNVTRNLPISHVVVNALAIGNQNPTVFAHTEAGNLGSTSFLSDASGELSVEAPRCLMTLSQLYEQYGPFDLIKLDIEGAELDVLRHALEFLCAERLTLWVECNEAPLSLEIAELFLSRELDVFYFAFPSHNPDNFNAVDNAIFPFAYEAGLLVSPRKTPLLSEQLAKHGCVLCPVLAVEDLRAALWVTPRWGMSEWHGKTLGQVAALAGRTLRGDDYASFLTAGWEPPKQMLWEKIDFLTEALARREAEAKDYEQMSVRSRNLECERAAALSLKRSTQAAILDKNTVDMHKVEHSALQMQVSPLEQEQHRSGNAFHEAIRRALRLIRH
jgi:FkbM family methyltransferase